MILSIFIYEIIPPFPLFGVNLFYFYFVDVTFLLIVESRLMGDGVLLVGGLCLLVLWCSG